MELFHQKLILFLSSVIALIFLYKLKLKYVGLERTVLYYLRTGAWLLSIAFFIGVIDCAFSSENKLLQSNTFYLIETVLGYLFGSVLITIGLFKWTKNYFDQKGNPLHKLYSNYLKNGSNNNNIDEILSDLLQTLDCQATTFHILDKKENLYLAYQQGLTDISKKLIQFPNGKNNIYNAAIKTNQAIITDSKYSSNEKGNLDSKYGLLVDGIAVPVTFAEKEIGVISVFSINSKNFTNEDLELLTETGKMLWSELSTNTKETQNQVDQRLKEMLSVIAEPFTGRQSLIPSVIDSAKHIQAYLPFEKFQLFIHENYKPINFEFSLPDGGLINIKKGYFTQSKFPEIFNNVKENNKQQCFLKEMICNQDRIVYPIGDKNNTYAHLIITLKSSEVYDNSYLPLVCDTIGYRILKYLQEESKDSIHQRNINRLGALRYFQEKAIISKDISELFNEIISSVVELIPASFCRVVLINHPKNCMKTIALSQIRKLNWPDNYYNEISVLDKHDRCSITNCKNIRYFNQDNINQMFSESEIEAIFPDKIKHGIIIPIKMNSLIVGYIIVGDQRGKERNFDEGAIQFLNSITAIMSLFITWHGNIRKVEMKKEGERKLVVLDKSSQNVYGIKSTDKDKRLNISSCINGPLAGIMASCEFLKSNISRDKLDIDRCLDIIEKNATHIHDITKNKRALT